MTFDFRKSPDICHQSPGQLMAGGGGCNVCDEQCIHSVQGVVFTRRLVRGVDSNDAHHHPAHPPTIPPPSAVLTRRGALEQCQQPPATRAGIKPSRSLKCPYYRAFSWLKAPISNSTSGTLLRLL